MDIKLHIGAYSPNTMPLERLAKYLAELSKLLGEKTSVHLLRIEAGSTAPLVAVDREACSRVVSRVRSLNTARAPKELEDAYATINSMLEQDNASGKLVQVRELGQKKLEATILTFPGVQASRGCIQVSEESSIDGELVGLRGADETIHATLRLANGDSQSRIELSKDQARGIAQYLWSGVLRLHGHCHWEQVDGVWRLKRMKVSGFDVLEPAGLKSTVADLRAIKGSMWGSMEDPVEFLRELRQEG